MGDRRVSFQIETGVVGVVRRYLPFLKLMRGSSLFFVAEISPKSPSHETNGRFRPENLIRRRLEWRSEALKVLKVLQIFQTSNPSEAARLIKSSVKSTSYTKKSTETTDLDVKLPTRVFYFKPVFCRFGKMARCSPNIICLWPSIAIPLQAVSDRL